MAHSSDLAQSTAAVSESAESRVYLHGVQIEHLVFSEGTAFHAVAILITHLEGRGGSGQAALCS